MMALSPPTPKNFSPVKFRVRPRKFRAIETALLPLIKPTTLDTENFGGMLMAHVNMIRPEVSLNDSALFLLR